MKIIKKFILPVVMLVIFESGAISLWLTKDNLFYLFNFSYIGCSLAFGIVLAFVFKDNRAFCKYVCPITVFLKPMSYFALFRIKCDKDKCVSCGKCERVCPMDVKVTDNSRKRQNGTECILCMECVKNCPHDAL